MIRKKGLTQRIQTHTSAVTDSEVVRPFSPFHRDNWCFWILHGWCSFATCRRQRTSHCILFEASGHSWIKWPAHEKELLAINQKMVFRIFTKDIFQSVVTDMSHVVQKCTDDCDFHFALLYKLLLYSSLIQSIPPNCSQLFCNDVEFWEESRR